MVFPIHLKPRPWTLALCLAGFAPFSCWAAATDWNCTRTRDNQQWVCASKKPEAPQTGRPETPGEAPAERAPSEPTPPRREIARPAPPEKSESPTQAQTPPRTEPEPPAEIPAKPVAPTQPETMEARSPREAPLSSEEPEGETAPAELKQAPKTPQPRPAQTGPATKAQRPGWNCRSGKPGESGPGWDCTLVGPDPGGLPHAVDERGKPLESWTEATTITEEDEQRFQKMMSLLPADPWKNVCIGGRRPPPVSEFILTPEDRLAREKAPLNIHSDYFEMLDSEVSNFSGSAELTRADQKLKGNFITRNTLTNAVNVQGNVIYQEKGFVLSSDTAFMDTDASRGVFRNSQFLLNTVPSRGTSRLTHLDSSTLSRYETVTYTSCPPGDQDWLLHASRVKINKETGVGTAQNAWLEFKDIPLFYTPYMSFPTDNRRMTGLLSPSFGISRVSGFDFTVPYYFNLAPNYDYTATPRYLTKRGFMLRNEFRYLTRMTRGRILAEIVPHDELAGTTRGQAGFLNDTRFTENLIAHVDANYVSDSRYLNQLGSQLNLVDRRNIRSIGYLTYSGSNYSLRTQVDYFQTIDPTIPPQGRPYFHLPQIAFNYANGIAGTGLVFDGQVQMDGFETSGIDKTTGQRLKLRPRLYYPFQTAAGFITPSFTLLHSEYWLQDPQFWAQLSGTKTNDTESLTAPIFSLDSGSFFERDFELGNTPMLQTLEPRLFYVYIPKVKQEHIPVFDSTQYDFTFYQLFRENRFTGGDRVGDANQLTAALTSRLIDQSTGLERLRGSVGNIFYFQDQQVTLFGPPPPAQLRSNSNVVAEVFAGITESWSFRTGGQWNPDSNRIDRAIVSLQYNNRRNDLLNVAYRFRRNQNNLDCIEGDPNSNCLNLTDVSFRLPIVEGWHAIGRWQYSLMDQITLESFVGIERETCCWRFTLLGRHYLNNIQAGATTAQANNGVFVQLEFKGLTRIGDQVDQFLERSVSGYRYRDNF